MAAFAEMVGAQFDFLTRHGFRREGSAGECVRFSSDLMVVMIFRGRHSGNIGIEVGSASEFDVDPSSRFSLADLCAWAGIDPWPMQVSTIDAARRTVRRLAEFLDVTCGPVIDGDMLSISRLREIHREGIIEYNVRGQIRAFRESAVLAWAARDYAAVIRSLSAIEPHLSPSERRKLKFAQKRLGEIEP